MTWTDNSNKEVFFESYTSGWRRSPGRRRERLSVQRCHTEHRPPPPSWAASQVWGYKRKRSHEPLNLSLDILLVLEMWRFLATMYHDWFLLYFWHQNTLEWTPKQTLHSWNRVSVFFLSLFHEIPRGFGLRKHPPSGRTDTAILRLSVYFIEQIQICLTLFQHSSHTSGHRQEGAAHLEFAGEEESERRSPLLMSCTSAASTTTTATNWLIRTRLTDMQQQKSENISR